MFASGLGWVAFTIIRRRFQKALMIAKPSMFSTITEEQRARTQKRLDDTNAHALQLGAQKDHEIAALQTNSCLNALELTRPSNVGVAR